MSVNEQQNIAIHHKDGPMMVLAGPGSGKTFVLTRRLQAMTTEMDIDPSGILVITFTKTAAEEMQERFQSLMKDDFMPVTFGTFHSIYFHIVKETMHYSGKDILTEKEKHAYLKDVLSELYPSAGNAQLGFDTTPEHPFLPQILADISKIKNDGTSPESYHPAYLAGEDFGQIYKAYETQCNLRHKVDFDDMVLLCYRTLTAHPDILKSWQQRYQYILVDEFQDINPMQYEVIKLLAHPENNLFIVGDDDQSIYGFRGSKPGIMLHFPKDYPATKTICLPKNYRSKASIVDSAISLIGHNQSRYQKSLSAATPGKCCVYEKGFPSSDLQTEEIIKLILSYQKVGVFKDIAILFRTNTGAKRILQKLTEHSIPFYYKEKIDSIWKKPEILVLLSLLAYAHGECFRSHLLRFMNKPVRYIKRSYLTTPVILIKDLLNNKDIPLYCKNNLRILLTDLTRIKSMEPYPAISYIRKVMGLDTALLADAKNTGRDETEILENLDLVQQSASGFSSYDVWKRKTEEYAEMTQACAEKPEGDYLTLQTMHGSKGLEYKIVILPDCNEGNVPQGKNASKETIEEERRIFYVAMTRAKELLFLFYISKTPENRKEKSRFLLETKGMTKI
ncbi:MAG: ATP-dependent helicase [Lachnospiraceae bacterium]|nr:ATP-dependent helicase [Lachnospiraceae bacterium]